MKLKALSKHIGASILVLGVAISCGSTPEKDSATDGSMTKKGPTKKENAASAIQAAKSALTKAQNANGAWKNTGSMIKDAEKAMAAGDFDKAVSMANKAEEEANNAILQASVENNKFKPTTELNGSSSNGLTSYSVKGGDNLWAISSMDNIYADPFKWPLIYKANSSKISDPDLIYPGQVFDINQNALSEETEAAISHARNRGAWSIGAIESSDRNYLAE
jgi:nucleoid-associated protein YgaU